MSITFENAKIGDKVWSVGFGWGEVSSIVERDTYPIKVLFSGRNKTTYTLEGKQLANHVHQTLYWDEVVFKAPTKPLPALDVDTEVLVWMHPSEKHRRHFSHFNSQRKIHCFVNGRTSWTTKQTSDWLYWELRE